MISERKTGLKVILWVLLVLNMAAIFLMSARTADESTVQSDVFAEVPMAAYDSAHPEDAGNEDVFWLFQKIVRKIAHFLEFAELAVWAVGLAVIYDLKLPYLTGAAFSAVYATTDELHQLFVPGREGKVTDWLIDTAGAITAAVILRAIIIVSRKRRNNCKPDDSRAIISPEQKKPE